MKAKNEKNTIVSTEEPKKSVNGGLMGTVCGKSLLKGDILRLRRGKSAEISPLGAVCLDFGDGRRAESESKNRYRGSGVLAADDMLNMRECDYGLKSAGLPKVIGSIGAGNRVVCVDENRVIATGAGGLYVYGEIEEQSDGTIEFSANDEPVKICDCSVDGVFVVKQGNFLIVSNKIETLVLRRIGAEYERMPGGVCDVGMLFGATEITAHRCVIPSYELRQPLSRWNGLSVADENGCLVLK